MNQDINTRQDIEFLVNTFYQSIEKDDLLGPVFNQVAEVNWDEHLPTMYSFWETLILGKTTYRGNPMIKHIALNQKERLTEEHFARWITIWNTTIDEKFSGQRVDIAKQKADMIKNLMLNKIKQSNESIDSQR